MDDPRDTESRNATLERYSAARMILMFSERFGHRIRWTDRPNDIPPDFTEPHVSVLAQDVRDTWGTEEGDAILTMQDQHLGALVEKAGAELLRQFLLGMRSRRHESKDTG